MICCKSKCSKTNTSRRQLKGNAGPGSGKKSDITQFDWITGGTSSGTACCVQNKAGGLGLKCLDAAETADLVLSRDPGPMPLRRQRILSKESGSGSTAACRRFYSCKDSTNEAVLLIKVIITSNRFIFFIMNQERPENNKK